VRPLDDLVLDTGGRLYLAKESRTTADALHRCIPASTSGARCVPPSTRPECSFRHVQKAGPVIDAVGNPQSLLLLGGSSEIGIAVAAKVRRGPAVAGGTGRPARPPAGRGRGSVAHQRFARSTCCRSTPAAGIRTSRCREGLRDGDIDVTLVAFGVLGDQEAAWTDVAAARELAEVNYVGAVTVGRRVGGTAEAPGPRLAGRTVHCGRRAPAQVQLRLRVNESRPGQLLQPA